MSEVFGEAYANAYNLLYSDKDYNAECDLIHRLFQRYADNSVSTVLDLGCGTGNHVFPLSQRGYEVVGIDRSESMLALARQRSSEHSGGGHVVFRQGDVRNVQIGRQFDAAAMMFAVLGYQVGNSDVLATLKTVRAHLRPNGLFIFDVWYGPAVLRQRPSERIKVTPTQDGRILRVASGDLDVARHTCSVRFHVWQLAGQRLEAETEETHVMRYFFPLELNLFLESSGLTPIRLGAFPDFDQEPDETTWNVLGVARAV
jgi:SAM-dependent methyltransferase